MNVVELLERAALRNPGKVAFADDSSELTYAALWDVAQRVASGILSCVDGQCRPIAVLIDRNVQSVATFMGILLSGNFYVPIDASMPAARIHTILGRIRPAMMVRVGSASFEPGDEVSVRVVDYDELAACAVDEDAILAAKGSFMDTDPCYAICTSGSTGTPKAVLVSHLSVIDFISTFVQTFGFDEDEVFGNQAPFDFDVSVKDIFSTLYCGATCVIIARRCFAMPKLLVRVLEERRVTTLVWAVSALCVVAGVNGFKNGAPSYLRKVLFSGEVMPVKQLNVWRAALSDATFVNLYGPTEATCNCMYYVLDRDFVDDERLPLGRVFANERVVVLNNNNPVEPGGTGEICVMGTCVALGYYNDDEATQRAFVQNPLNDAYPQRMYRTGDLAELSVTGELYFAGRKDFQIKHMGHRIELEEIETHLQGVVGVERAICHFDDRRNKIVAFYMGDAERADIVRSLRTKVPKYMVPNVFRRVDSLPLTKNGKTDRAALRKMYEDELA